MALKTRAELKAYFETNDVPTVAQYIDLIDSIFNLTDDVGVSGYGLWTRNGDNLYYNSATTGKFGFSTNSPTAKIHAVCGSIPFMSVGASNTISGNLSAGIGSNNTVSGTGGFAIGDQNSITVNDSYAFGKGNTVTSGTDSILVGIDHIANYAGTKGYAFGEAGSILHPGAMVINTDNDGAGCNSDGNGMMTFQSNGFHFYLYDTLRFVIHDLPTSASGLPTGSLWRDSAASNVIKMVP